MIEAMLNRRSIRKFKDEDIKDDMQKRLLTAGLLAPSSKNKKPVRLIAVTDKETISKLKACKHPGGMALETARFVIAVAADTTVSDVWVEDASIAATYIMLEAEQLGLGCTWVQLRRREGEAGHSEDMVRAVLNIPEEVGVVALMSIGIRDEEKKPYTESSLDWGNVRMGTF